MSEEGRLANIGDSWRQRRTCSRLIALLVARGLADGCGRARGGTCPRCAGSRRRLPRLGVCQVAYLAGMLRMGCLSLSPQAAAVYLDSIRFCRCPQASSRRYVIIELI
jgi:hypothetical protein